MTITVTNVRVFDGEELAPVSAVRFDRDGIVGLGGPDLLRSGGEHVDGLGGTVLPGLIDAHVHLLPGCPSQALTFGVTTLLDMFSKPPLVGECIEKGRTATGANVFSSSIGATAPGGHPSMMYAPFPYVTGPADAEAFVADRRAEGASYLKVLYEGGRNIEWPMPALDLATIEALVAAAHRAGLLVAAHVHRAADAVDLVRRGVDVLAHVPTDDLDDRQVQAIAASGAAVIATLSVADGFPRVGRPMPLLEQPALARRLGPAWTRVLQAQATRWRPPQLPDFATAHANVGRLHRAGVRILAGTDAPNPGTVHGASLHRELQRLVRSGLSSVAALQAATGAVADTFGLDGRGRIAVGNPADLLLTYGRPDQSVDDSQTIVAVWKGGQEAPIDGYVGSAAESAGIAALREQTERVLTAVAQRFPQFTAADRPD